MIKKTIESSIINIDSQDRIRVPKHIYESFAIYLDNNPLEFYSNSKTVRIKYTDHPFKVNDMIILQNVEGRSDILTDSIYLINDFNYAVIIWDINIPINYKNYIDILYILIETYINNNNINFIDNIPLNSIIGIKQVFISTDLFSYITNSNNILEFSNIPHTLSELINTLFPSSDINNILTSKCLFINLYKPYTNPDQKSFVSIPVVCNISELHINGINLGYLNANYPINNYNYQPHHIISNIINNDLFEITISKMSYNNKIGGGKNIFIYKILNTIIGYPEHNNYTINLKKTF